MANIKISLIGAGSGCFSIGLIRDLCLSKNLANSTISLMDINSERLDAIYDLPVVTRKNWALVCALKKRWTV